MVLVEHPIVRYALFSNAHGVRSGMSTRWRSADTDRYYWNTEFCVCGIIYRDEHRVRADTEVRSTIELKDMMMAALMAHLQSTISRPVPNCTTGNAPQPDVH